MAYRCDRCRYVCQDLQMMVRHMQRHKNPAPKVLTETYSADKNAPRDKEHN